MTLYRRLIIATVIAVITVATSCIAVYHVQEQFLIERIDNRLLSLESRLQAVVRKVTTSGRPQPIIETALSDFYVGRRIADGTFETLLAPVSTPESSPFISPSISSGEVVTVATWQGGDMRMRVLVRDSSNGQRFVIGVELDEYLENLRTLRNLLVGLFVASTAVIVLVVWWVLVLGIRPVRKMVTVAKQIASSDRRARMEESHSSTETAELGRALNQMIDVLDASERRMARFVADASHELRTPLSVLTGYSEIYLSGGLRTAVDVNDAMSRIQSTSARMKDIVEDLLALLSEESNQSVRLESIAVAAMLERCAQDAQLLDPNRVIVSTCESDVTVRSDEHRIMRVIMAFVENAVVHSHRQGKISISAIQVGDDVRFSVTDDGPGIPPSLVSQIFEPFVKADSARTQSASGSGLGLAIASRLVDTLGGRIGVDSTSSNTTFWFVLPA